MPALNQFIMSVYKNWILENQKAVPRLLEEELDYWLMQVEEEEKAAGGGVARVEEFQVPAGQALSNVEIQNRVMAAFLFSLGKVTGSQGFVVYREGHGRNSLTSFDVSEAIGWFTCKYPTRYAVTRESLLQTLEAVAKQNASVPNGGVAYDVLKHFGPSYVNRQLECTSGILFNYLGDISFKGGTPIAEDQDRLILSSHSSFSSTFQQGGDAGAGALFGLNVNAWMADGQLGCSVEVAPSLGLDADACKSFLHLFRSHLEELFSGGEDIQKIKPVPFQKGLISYVVNNPESADYINQNVFETGREISRDFFYSVCRTLADKYEILRTCYAFDFGTGDFTAAILPPGTVTVEYHSVPANAELKPLLSAIKRRPFRIDREPLIRFSLIEEGGRGLIVITSHHIIIDGTSVVFLLQELLQIAEELAAGKTVDTFLPQNLRFSTYAKWINSKDEPEAAGYWKKLLAGAEPCLLENHTAGEETEGVELFGNLEYEFAVCSETLQALQERNITMAVAFNYLAGYVLAKYAGKDSFIWGNTVTVRPPDLEGSEMIVGPCIATLPVTMDFDTDKELLDSMKDLQLQLLESREYGYLTLSDISKCAGHPLLFSASCVYQNFFKASGDARLSGSFQAHASEDQNISAHFPINLLVFEKSEGLSISVKYRRDQFARSLIGSICRNISVLLNNLHLLGGEAVRQIDFFRASGAVRSELEGERFAGLETTLHGAFMEAARTYPERVAVKDPERSFSYAELDAISNGVCKVILDNGLSGVIGIRMRRTANLVPVIVGILKAGCRLVSLEHDFPAEKIAWIAVNVKMQAVFTDDDEVVMDGGIRVFHTAQIEPLYNYGAMPEVSPSSLCCINYTSGSTGVPKLVQISHAGHVNRIQWLKHGFPAAAGDLYGFKTLLCFGPSLREVFEPLVQGSTLYVYSQESNNDPAVFHEETRGHGVSRLFLTPTFLRLLYDCGLQEALSPLTYLEISGEPIAASLFDRLTNDFPGAKIVGRYGATEAPGTVYHTGNSWPDERNLPLGRPIFNTGVAVLGQGGRMLPTGVIGEIGIRGASISTGYVNKELEPENFILADGQRYVKTGDLGYINEEGILVFRSRKTRMVKIKGYRVEPAEVEFQLMQHPSVQKAFVVPVSAGSSTRLVAFYMCSEPAAASDLRKFLELRLPRYMIPHEFTALAVLPLTGSGKVDYVTLSKYAVAGNAADIIPPKPGMEQLVFGILKDLLEHDDFDAVSNFPEIGMDSILTLKALYRIRTATGIAADVSDLYMNPTVRDLAALLERKAAGDAGEEDYYFVNRRDGNEMLFFVPPAGNSQIDLKALESAVPPHVTLVIFRAINLESSMEASLQEIASGYNRLVRELAGNGRVHLSGWSLGATIAYEMAAQLEKEGAATASLLLFDPGFYNPGYDASLTESKLEEILGGMLGAGAIGDAQLRQKVMTDIVKANKLIVDYSPSAFSGRVTLFKPSDISSEERNYNRRLNDLDLYCKGAIELVCLEGNHMTMLANVLQNNKLIQQFVVPGS